MPPRWIALALLGVAAACANTGEPPGGPPDEKPPVVLGVFPESGAVVPDLRAAAVIQYDGVIDELGGGGAGGRTAGIMGLAARVVLSPTRGPVKVSWHRSSIHVKPVEGWKPGRVYRLELLPGIADLRHNVTKESRVIVFSTGPDIPQASLAGVAVQWVEQRPLPGGLIRAVLLPDTIAYLTVTDSTGAFRLNQVPPGRYAVFAIVDQNTNRLRDRREAYDSALVTLDTSAAMVLWTFIHDTVGPRLRQVDPIDSSAARLTFSQPLDPALRLDSLRVRVLALPDSGPLRVRAVLTSAAFDSLTAREQAAADSARAAADTTARRAPADTTRADTTPPAIGRVRRPAAAPPAPDTSAVRLILRQRPVPSDKLVLRVDTTFTPGDRYYVEVRGARNLNGARADGHAVLVVPKPKPAPLPRADTTRTRPDSTRPRPPPPRAPRDSTRP
jgi:hypothetical protein